MSKLYENYFKQKKIDVRKTAIYEAICHFLAIKHNNLAGEHQRVIFTIKFSILTILLEF